MLKREQVFENFGTQVIEFTSYETWRQKHVQEFLITITQCKALSRCDKYLDILKYSLKYIIKLGLKYHNIMD